MRRLAVSLLAMAVAAGLTACGSGANSGMTGTSDKIVIVASTDVYGSIARTIGGDRVEVTSVIAGASQDPHSYEATARDRLAVSRADIVIVNGGGYDPFMETLLGSAAAGGATVLNASELSGLEPEHVGTDEGQSEDAEHRHLEGFNEHVWYDVGAVRHLAEALAAELSSQDTAHASEYRSRLDDFVIGVDGLGAELATIAARAKGWGVAITEPVPLYLLEAAGLANRTPVEFSEAVEEGTDVPPTGVQRTLTLFTDRAVVLLAYNEQTASSETEKVRRAAEAAGIPVVTFTETLPDGDDYLTWMTRNVESIAAALR